MYWPRPADPLDPLLLELVRALAQADARADNARALE